MKTKPFTLVVCPSCGCVIAIGISYTGIHCVVCDKHYDLKDCYKLGLKKIEKTGEEIWMGVKEE